MSGSREKRAREKERTNDHDARIASLHLARDFPTKGRPKEREREKARQARVNAFAGVQEFTPLCASQPGLSSSGALKAHLWHKELPELRPDGSQSAH